MAELLKNVMIRSVLPQRLIAFFATAFLCVAVLRAGEVKESSTPAEVVDVNPTPNLPPRKTLADVIEPGPEQENPAQANLPRAEITADGEVAPGCWLLLDGTKSVSPTKTELEFEWQQTLGPSLGLLPAELKQSKLWIFLAQPGETRIVLRAKNENGWSLPREVKLNVKAGRGYLTEKEARQIVGAGEKVSFPGEGWRQVEGASVELRYENGVTSFRPALSGLYLFEAPRAGDIPERRGAYVPPGRDGTFGDRRPLARMPRNLNGQTGKPVLISAVLSSDPDGDEETKSLTARWIQLEKNRNVSLQPMNGLRAKFTAQRAGTYAVSLVVSDGRLDSSPPETCYIQITDAPPTENLSPLDMGWEDTSDIEKDDVRYRKVSLGLWGTLERAVQMFPSRCGIALRVELDLATPEKFDKIPLALEVMDGYLMQLIDWVARQTDSRYHRESDRSLWLTTPAAWAKHEKLQAAVVSADALYDKPDGSDLTAMILPIFQQILATREGASLALEPTRKEFQGVLPVSAFARLNEICKALRVPEGYGLPPREMPSPFEYRLQKTLAEKTVTLKASHRRLDYLLRDLATASGVACAFDPRQFPKGLPVLDVNIENAPLRDAVRTIVDLAGFSGCNVEAPSGLWFYCGERPYPSGEVLWDHSIVRSYDLSKLLQRIQPFSGEAIAYAIQRRIYPQSWKDLGAGVFFHPQTRKLIVMHGPAAHRAIVDFLQDLSERGEWALGPVDDRK